MKALHPDVAALLRASRGAPLGTLEPAQMRQDYLAARRASQFAFVQLPAVEDLSIAVAGVTVAARLYKGHQADGPRPCLLYLHGGGWVLGNLDTHEGLCRRLAAELDAWVLALDYRLAPEHPFPAALHDAIGALRWMVSDAAAGRGIDPALLAVGGDSAGANLAAVLAIMGAQGSVPQVACQVLFYPVTDLRMETASYAAAGEGLPLTPAAMRYFARHYLPQQSLREDWRVSPLLAPSLASTPPAFVLTCGHDPLEDEGRLYAERLIAEGCRVTYVHMSDQVHGFLNQGGAIAPAAGVVRFAAATLGDAWRVSRQDPSNSCA